MAEWLGRWTCNLVVPGSSPPPCNSLDLFSVAPSSTPWLRFVNSQLVWLLPVGIFNHFMFIYHVCFLFVCIGPEKPRWGSGQLRLLRLLLSTFVLPQRQKLSHDSIQLIVYFQNRKIPIYNREASLKTLQDCIIETFMLRLITK